MSNQTEEIKRLRSMCMELGHRSGYDAEHMRRVINGVAVEAEYAADKGERAMYGIPKFRIVTQSGETFCVYAADENDAIDWAATVAPTEIVSTVERLPKCSLKS